MPQKRNKSSKPNALGSVRIIGGKHRGQKLPVRHVEGLRPTTDRIKETVFNWLQSDIVDAHCADLFSGAGALSFEAISRGAKQLTTIDIDPQNTQLLAQNKARLGANNIDIICSDALLWLQQQTSALDIIFIDPPFNSDLLNQSLETLSQHPCVQSYTQIYIEASRQAAIDLPAHWHWHRHKTSGDVQYGIAIPNSTN